MDVLHIGNGSISVQWGHVQLLGLLGEDLLSEGIFEALGKFFSWNLASSMSLEMLGEASLESMLMAKVES